MAVRRSVEQVAGSPERIASRMAVRLAYLGEDVEGYSTTEFEWRPKRAERFLFRTPAWVRVTCLAAEQPGFTNVVTEWDPRGFSGRWLPLAVLGIGAMGLLAAFLVPGGWPAWKLLFLLWPLVFAAAAGPSVLSSGSLSFIRKLAATGSSGALDSVPGAEAYLSAETEEERQAVVLALRETSARISAEQSGFKKLPYGGQDRRSTIELMGWPLWHQATGRDPVTDMVRLARGWYAAGQYAQGAVAAGQRAQGWVAAGQLAYGFVAVGQAAVGLIAGIGQAGIGGLFGAGQFGLGLIAAGMVAAGTFIAALPPMHDAIGLILAPVAAILTLLVILLTLLGTRLGLRRAQESEISRQLESHRLHERQYAEESSLSRVDRMGPVSPDKGLSAAEVDVEA